MLLNLSQSLHGLLSLNNGLIFPLSTNIQNFINGPQKFNYCTQAVQPGIGIIFSCCSGVTAVCYYWMKYRVAIVVPLTVLVIGYQRDSVRSLHHLSITLADSQYTDESQVSAFFLSQRRLFLQFSLSRCCFYASLCCCYFTVPLEV